MGVLVLVCFICVLDGGCICVHVWCLQIRVFVSWYVCIHGVCV